MHPSQKNLQVLSTHLRKINKTTIHTSRTHFHTKHQQFKFQKKKLILTLTQLIMYEIWTSRNNIKYDKIQLSQETIITNILTQLWNIITAHYKLHKLNEMLPTFQQLFCINDALAKIYNCKLQIIIQEKSVRVLLCRNTAETTLLVSEVLQCECVEETTQDIKNASDRWSCHEYQPTMFRQMLMANSPARVNKLNSY